MALLPPNPRSDSIIDDYYVRKGGQTDYYSDDANYLKMIEQYKDQSWYNRLLENPYLASKTARFSPNFWQNLAQGWFDDTSGHDNYYSQIAQNSMNWLSDTLAQMHQQDYDSAEQQVEREKAAGLNSDINGQITSGLSAENDNPLPPVSMSQESVIPSVISSLSTIGSLANTITSASFSVISSIQSIAGTHLENVLKRFGLNETLRGTAWNIIKGGIGEYMEGNSIEPGTIFDKPEYVRSVSRYFYDRLDRLPYTNKEKRMLRPVIDSLVRSKGEAGQDSFTTNFEKLVNDSYSELYQSRNDVAKSSAQPGANKETIAALRFIGEEIYKPLADLQNDVNKLVLRYQKGFNSELLKDEIDPVTGQSLGNGASIAAKAQKRTHLFQRDMYSVKNRLTSVFERINSKITGSNKLPEFWKFALEAGTATAESIAISKIFGTLQ